MNSNKKNRYFLYTYKMQHHSEEMNNIMKKFESEAVELEQKYEQKLTSQYESLTLKHRMEITEVEERKNAQIANLIKNHENAFAEIKNYYNDITLNNLSLIKSMKVNSAISVVFKSHNCKEEII